MALTNNLLLCFENLCMYIARNHNYPTAVFFSFVYRFLQDLNKVVVVDDDDDDDDDDYYYYFQSPGFFNLLFPVFVQFAKYDF